MIKNIVISLVLLLSCDNNKSNKDIVGSSISFLREIDVSNSYNLYYVIETNDSLLYIVNTNKENRLSFMYFFDTTDCKAIDGNEYIIYLRRSFLNPQRDNCVGKNFNLPHSFDGTPITEINGMIYKIFKENGKAKYILLKKGNILEEINKDSQLVIEEVIEDVTEI